MFLISKIKSLSLIYGVTVFMGIAEAIICLFFICLLFLFMFKSYLHGLFLMVPCLRFACICGLSLFRFKNE